MSELSDKALGFWKLDEDVPPPSNSGFVYTDEVAGLNDMTSNGSMSDAAGVCSGLAAHFTPGIDSSSMQRASTADLETGWVEWTGWVYSVAFSSGGGTPWFCKNNVFPASADYQLFQNNDVGNTVRWDVRNFADSATASVNAGAVTPGWHFFDCYYDGVNIGLSLDGGAFVTTPLTTRKVSSSTFALARDPGVGSYHFNDGRLSNLGMWGSALTSVERDYLRGVTNGGCPPEWPFVDAPGSDIAFEFYAAKLRSRLSYSGAAYGTKTYLLVQAPVSGKTRKVSAAVVDMNGAQPGDLVEFKLRRDGDDPLDDSTARCTVPTVAVDYSTRS